LSVVTSDTDGPSDPEGQLPRAHGGAAVRGLIRVLPEDFFVDETLPFEPDGEGEHLLLRVTKTGQNTGWVAAELARSAGIHRRDVSFAGRKDRHAVTTQWFCLRIPSRTMAAPADLMPEGCELVESAWHRRKLRTGHLTANCFRIRVRELEGDLGLLEARLRTISTAGVPNFFTEQRFGRGGSVTTPPSPPIPRARDARSMWLSAARSALFNRVLAARVSDGSWCVALEGELLMLRDSHSRFLWEGGTTEPADQAVPGRVADGELHPSGPLAGDTGAGGDRPGGAVAALEEGVLSECEDTIASLVSRRVDADRRALRVMPSEMSWQIDADTAEVVIEMRLPPGCYATAVIREAVDYRLPSMST
jgi:tRNA pseudouridine13 synthase